MAQLSRIESGIHGIAKASEKEIQSIDSLVKKATTAVATYASFASVGGLIQDVVRVRGEMQGLSVAFETMLGSKQKADKLMGELVTFAATTPFELTDVAKAAKQLTAFGITAEKIQPTLRALGDVSAGIGAPITEIAELYGKARVQGRLFAEDINQLTGRGIPIIQELAKQFGVADEEVKGLVESGKVGFPQIETAFQNLTKAGSMFGGLMEAQSRTLTGALSNMRDSWAQVLNSIGESNEGIFMDAIQGATNLIQNYQKVLDLLKMLAIAYGSYKAAVIATAAIQQVQGRMAVQNALAQMQGLKSLTAAQQLHAVGVMATQKAYGLLQRAMNFMANPAVLVSAFVAIAGALYVMRQRMNEVKTAAELMADATKEAAGQFAKQEGEIKQYIKVLGDQNIAESVRLDAYNKLKQIAPEIIGQLSFQAAKTADLTNATNIYIASLKQRIQLETMQAKYAEALKKQAEDFEKVQANEKNGKRSGFTGSIGDYLANAFSGRSMFGTFGTEMDNAVADYRLSTQTVTEMEEKLQQIVGEGTPEALKARIAALENANKYLNKNTKAYKDNEDQINSLKKSLQTLNSTVTVSQSNKKLIDEAASLDALKKVREKIDSAYNAETDKVKKEQLAADLRYADERKKILDPYGAYKKGQSEMVAGEKKVNALLEQRDDILKTIADTKRQAEADTNGKQASAIEKINQKYSALIEKVADYNKKVGEWNKDPKNKKNQVNQIGYDATRQIYEARALEISQEMMEQDVKNYETSLKEKSDLYKKYQQSVQEVGRQDAQKLYEGEKLAFDSYLDYLKSEIGKIGTKISLGVDLNLADEGKLKLLTQELKNVTKEQADQQIEDTKRVMVATLNAAEQRKVIEANYLKEVEILRKTYTGKDLEERERVLKDALNADLINLAGALGQQTELYRKMNKDIYSMANSRINSEIALLEKQLKELEGKDPGLAKAIREAIEAWKKLQQQMNGTEDKLEGVIKGAGQLGSAFSSLAGDVAPFNEGLSEALSLVGGLVSGVGNAASSFKTFKEGIAKGGIEGTLGAISGGVGMIGAAFSVISTIDGIVSRSQEKKMQAYREEKQRQVDIITGEMEINQLYRERAREQVLINKLRLEGIEAEMRLLEEQKKKNDSDVTKTLDALSKEFRKDYNVNLGNFQLPNGQMYRDAMSLAGKTFEELERLAAMNLLNDRSKELFDTLKKLKDEGVDIEKARQEAIQREKETLTATSAESISDSIIEGFKKGYRSAKDFADNFQELMQGALINALKYQTLEAPLKAFYEQFAQDAKSGGALTQSEIATLQEQYNALITDAAKQFEDLQKVTGVSFKGGNAATNSLQGAIKGITEQQAELLAGQFGGQRLATLELLKVAQQNLNIQNKIQNNTASTVTRLEDVVNTMHHYFTTGIKIK